MQKAIDLSHHLSDLSRARATSPLKGLARYFGRPGLISLAGGTLTFFVPLATPDMEDPVLTRMRHQACPARHTSPLLPSRVTVCATVAVLPARCQVTHASAFPALVPDSFALDSSQSGSSFSWLWKLFGSSPKEKTRPITIPKYPATKDDVTLATALQYGTATGLPQLQKFINEFVEKTYQPAYSDWQTLVQTGNTDGSVPLRPDPIMTEFHLGHFTAGPER